MPACAAAAFRSELTSIRYSTAILTFAGTPWRLLATVLISASSNDTTFALGGEPSAIHAGMSCIAAGTR
jgi:hypothetical protein